MKKTDSLKRKILEELERVPIIQRACERCGISRNTFYNWLRDDVDFAVAVKMSVESGVDLVSDVAEGGLFKSVQEAEPWAIKYFLSRRNKNYRHIHFAAETAKPDPEEHRLMIEAAKKRAKEMLNKWIKEPETKK